MNEEQFQVDRRPADQDNQNSKNNSDEAGFAEGAGTRLGQESEELENDDETVEYPEEESEKIQDHDRETANEDNDESGDSVKDTDFDNPDDPA